MKPLMMLMGLPLLAAASCNTAKHDKAEAKHDAAAIEQKLKSIEAEWEKHYQARDVDKLAGHYVDDAALANPGATLATSTASRRLGIEQFVADPNLKVSFSADRVGVASSGDLAYTRGHYSTETTDPKTKEAVTQVGNYLTVWKKQGDGSWKVVEDFVTPGAAPTP